MALQWCSVTSCVVPQADDVSAPGLSQTYRTNTGIQRHGSLNKHWAPNMLGTMGQGSETRLPLQDGLLVLQGMPMSITRASCHKNAGSNLA